MEARESVEKYLTWKRAKSPKLKYLQKVLELQCLELGGIDSRKGSTESRREIRRTGLKWVHKSG